MRGARSFVLMACAVMFLPACRKKSPGPAPCLRQFDQLCLIQRFDGTDEGGDLGFRFGPPLDANGDGVNDIAAGARFARFPENPHDTVGTVSVWSGASGTPMLRWRGIVPHGLLGHAVTLVPDLDGDRLADLVAAAPTGRPNAGAPVGFLYARSPMSGEMIWTITGRPGDSFGWDLARAGDQDQDGIEDLFVGAPGGTVGAVYLISGRDGAVLATYRSSMERDSFGWYVTRIPDLDDDGRDDLGVGAPLAARAGERLVGRAVVLSAASGARLLSFEGADEFAQMGEMLAALPDMTGDGKAEIAVSATYSLARPGPGPGDGQVFVYSGADGALVHHFRGRQERELYGRTLSRAGDLDSDGVEDLAVSAPWFRSDAQAGDRARVGRVEVRSGRTGEVLAEIVGRADDGWLGWHVEYAPDMGPDHEPGLMLSINRSRSGALELYAYRR